MEGIEKDRDMEGMKEFWASLENDQQKVIRLPKDGMIRLSSKHEERMYRQNRNKYQNACVWEREKILYMRNDSLIYRLKSVSIPDFCEIEAWTIAVDKFTIVEIVHNGKHYQGLSSQAKCDEPEVMKGIYNAYHRAFKSMIGM